MKEFDKIYIAKYYEQIGISELAKGFSTTKIQIENIVNDLRRSGLYKIYKNMSDTEWEGLENKKDKVVKERYLKQANEINKEIFQELLKTFKVNTHEIIMQFPKYKYQKEDFERDYMQEKDFEGEEWKKIGNLHYEISNYGRIKNTETKKLKKLKYNVFGMQVLLWQNSKSYTITISRLVAETFIRHLSKKEKVFHKNNNIRDNYYKNLYIKEI